MTPQQKEFLITMLNMSAQVLVMALDAMDRQPDDKGRRAKCFEAIRNTASDLRKLAESDTVGLK